MRQLTVAHEVHVAVWQWPRHRVLWRKRLPPGEVVSLIWQTEEGALICSLGSDHYCVLWPDDVRSPGEPYSGNR